MGDTTQNDTHQAPPSKPIEESTSQSTGTTCCDAEQSDAEATDPSIEGNEEENRNMRWLNTRRRSHKHIRVKRQNFRRKKY